MLLVEQHAQVVFAPELPGFAQLCLQQYFLALAAALQGVALGTQCGELAVLRADRHAQEAFVQLVAVGRIGVLAEERVVADVLDVRFLDRPAALLHPGAHDLGGLLALGVGWRAYLWALGLPIWGDEAFLAVNLIVRDFAGMWKPLVYGQIAPLVFMWAELAAVRVLGYSEHALHLLPCIAGIGGLVSPYVLPDDLKAEYGRDLTGYMVFGRLKLL